MEITIQRLLMSQEGPAQLEEGKTILRTGFLHLTLDLPPPPLFQGELERNAIPQVPIMSLLSKFNGATETSSKDSLKWHRILSLPRYLILHIKRFGKNNWETEKNPTVVHFPVANLDVGEGKTIIHLAPQIVNTNLIHSLCDGCCSQV